MAKLLYLESSPRKERSHSIAVAQSFLEAYQAANPNDEIDRWDLWATDLPPFDGDTINAKYAILHGQDHTPEQAAAWEAVKSAADRFKSADKVLISLPMWNFGMPYKLKHFIDVITQPTLTFSFSPESGYSGLVKGKPAAVVYARGGQYEGNDPSESMDFQISYIKLWLGFIGFEQVEHIVVEPTLGPPDAVEQTRQAAREKAQEVAQGF